MKVFPRLFSLLLVCFLLEVLSIKAQDLKYCGTTEAIQKLYEEHPELVAQEEAYYKQIREHMTSTRDSQPVYIIPIVFHILHEYGTEDISDAQVRDEVRILNNDYRKLNSDTTAIVPAFKNIAGDAHIEFRLAQKTPGGGCTNGIDRIQSHETYIGDDNSKLKQWPRNMYLNVWVAKTLNSGAAGYAYYPSAVSGDFAPYDGVMILSNYIGSIGTSNAVTSRALTHEIGHCLSLPHTWGSTNNPGVECGDDGVFDTPETKGWSTCNLNGSICHPPIIENVQNYMEYSYCSKMFTEGQAQLMRNVLENSVSDRDNLWTETNLEATGTNDGYIQECAPIADFNPNTFFICQGGSITFTDYSYNGTPTNWQWTFPNGTPPTSSESHPTVVFNTPGKQTITLTASNAQGSGTISRDIYVSGTSGEYAGNYHEGFDNVERVSSDWVMHNVDNNESQWSNSGNTGYMGSGSLLMNNFYGDDQDVDYFVSPTFDLSGTSEINLSFRYAGATRSTTSSGIKDALRILTSTDCGKTWFARYLVEGVVLENNGYHGTYFTPDATTRWGIMNFKLPAILAVPNLRFKFEFTSGGNGNNLYIDDFTVSQYVVGIESLTENFDALQIFPNPASDQCTISYSLINDQEVNISMYDLSGRKVATLLDDQQSRGDHALQIQPMQSLKLEAGVYFIRVQAGKETMNKMLVVQ